MAYTLDARIAKGAEGKGSFQRRAPFLSEARSASGEGASAARLLIGFHHGEEGEIRGILYALANGTIKTIKTTNLIAGESRATLCRRASIAVERDRQGG
ncbi:hypothetical protein KM043_013670 [Ampulex compressa]|nr:hypothetical protein KM043_013670 [Ampulex compressa]